MSTLILPPTVRSSIQAQRDELQSRALSLPHGNFRGPSRVFYRRVPALDLRMDDPDHGIVQALAWIRSDRVQVLAGLEPTTHSKKLLLHVSLALPDRDPSWDEIKSVKAAFFPDDIDAIMVLPKNEHWVNRHEHCFHLHQAPVEWGLM